MTGTAPDVSTSRALRQSPFIPRKNNPRSLAATPEVRLITSTDRTRCSTSPTTPGSDTSPKNWTSEMLVFAALWSGSLDSRRADEEELHVGADALHRATGRERYISGGSLSQGGNHRTNLLQV